MIDLVLCGTILEELLVAGSRLTGWASVRWEMCTIVAFRKHRRCYSVQGITDCLNKFALADAIGAANPAQSVWEVESRRLQELAIPRELECDEFHALSTSQSLPPVVASASATFAAARASRSVPRASTAARKVASPSIWATS